MSPVPITRPSARVRHVTLGGLLALLGLAALAPAAPPGEKSEKDKPASTAPAAVEAHFADGSALKLTLKEEKLELTTAYGKLSIPVTDVRRIDFATRISDEAAKKIDTALANLGSDNFQTREAATAELLKQGPRAYPALLEAARKNNDAEVKRRLEDLVEKIKASAPADQLEVRKADVVTTADSKISGRIEGTEWKAETSQFGEVKVKLADLRSLGAPQVAARLVRVLPDPGSPASLPIQVGQVYYIRVMGGTTGSVWGTDVYTTDSTLAAVSVHAGVLAAGQTGVVKVTILASPPTFQGTQRNGVTSSDYGPYPAAYQVSAPEEGLSFQDAPTPGAINPEELKKRFDR
jgi:LCCL domain